MDGKGLNMFAMRKRKLLCWTRLPLFCVIRLGYVDAGLLLLCVNSSSARVCACVCMCISEFGWTDIEMSHSFDG